MASVAAHSDQLLTRSSLVNSMRESDPDAWERFVKLYGGLVYSWCRRAGLGPEDSSDTMQEVFRSVHRGIENFVRNTKTGTFRGWLRVIMQNKIRDFYRATTGKPPATGGSDAYNFLIQFPSSGSSFNLPAGSDQPYLDEALSAVSAEFEPNTWRAFWLVTIDDRSPADVALSLGMTLGAVHTAKWRVLKRLRQYLDRVM